VKKPQRQSGFYWVSAHGEDFEPAKVDYENGKPISVWFAGLDVEIDPFQCVIGDLIVKPKDMKK
jgi:hypothetical protein